MIFVATADQVKSLVKAYIDRNDDRFKTIVLQIAAHEAKLGHDSVARDLKSQIEKLVKRVASVVQLTPQNPMLLLSLPKHDISELIVSDEITEKLQRILNEYRNRHKLHSYGLTNRRKILIEGQPGTGKTFTAAVIASELSLPLYTVQMDKLVTKFMGETSVKLRQIFDSINSLTGVYFFDEFDAIGADRSLDNEVGEMRRILNSFLQFIDQDVSESIIIAATNNQRLLDQALFRRFDDVLHYTLPTEDEIRRLLKCKLISYDKHFKITKPLLKAADGLNHAEIVKICDDAIKTSILTDQPLSAKQIAYLLQERRTVYSYKEAWDHALGSAPVTLKLTLSYFIEPGPGEIGWKDKYRYPSCGLRFNVINSNETEEDFKKRISTKMRGEDKKDKGDGSSGSDHWYLGSNNRDVGSIHSDFCELSAAELSDCNLIAVYPVVGWWRERAYLKRYDKSIRYALVVSLSTPRTDVDLYTPIITQITPAIEIPIPTRPPA